jgi:hypothetical protein
MSESLPVSRRTYGSVATLDAAGEDAFLSRIANNDKMGDIAASFGLSVDSLRGWLKATPKRKDRWMEARAARAEKLVEETESIADAVADAETSAQVAAAKLRIDNKWKVAAILHPEFNPNPPAAILNQLNNLGGTVNLGQLHLQALMKHGKVSPHPAEGGPVEEAQVVE